MSTLAVWSWSGWALVVVLGLVRSRFYAVFLAILLGIHNLIALPVLSLVRGPSGGPSDGTPLALVLLALHALVFVHFAMLVRPQMRPLWYRLLVSWPASYFSASVLLAWPWAIVIAFGLPAYGVWLPFLLGAIGFYQSLTLRTETRDIVVGRVARTSGVARVTAPSERREGATERPLRIVQITDPHLGPFMSVERLAAICRDAVEQEPDLVLLTGDFLTMESQAADKFLREALAPLAALPGRVFACLGNHDHEALGIVSRALESAGVHLLIDEAARVLTAAGEVEIVGFDYHFTGRKEKIAAVCARFPRPPGVMRIALLHDPGAFKHLPEGAMDLVLSGHTHGGHVGLVSLGSAWTVAGWVAKMPDHGLWGSGTSRLYVHRGTGHYGFPLRLGVPGERSVLSVHVAR